MSAGISEDARRRRWRLVLGEDAESALGCGLSGVDAGMDRALAALYGQGGPGDPRAQEPGKRKAGLGASAPTVARWLGDIRSYFPSSVVQVLQRDAIERRGWKQLLLEPELLSGVEADVHLVSELIALKGAIPARTKETARMVVRKVADELRKRLEAPLRQAVRGALKSAARTRRPRPADIDWDRTIRANLERYLPERKTVVAERLIGRGRKQRSLREVHLVVDQSGSMAPSVVHSSIAAAVLASIPALATRLTVFDTAVVDLTDLLADPVDVLFGAQLGGGTDIARALSYAREHIARPSDAVVVLISDLYEGGDTARFHRAAQEIVSAGACMVALLALSDDGAPSFDHGNAAALAAMGVPSFACTPDRFPELMAAALKREDLARWAASQGIVAARGR